MVFVDTSTWIDYFRGKETIETLYLSDLVSEDAEHALAVDVEDQEIGSLGLDRPGRSDGRQMKAQIHGRRLLRLPVRYSS